MSSIQSSSSLLDLASDLLYADRILTSSRLIPPEHVETAKSNSRFEPPTTRREKEYPIYLVQTVIQVVKTFINKIHKSSCPAYETKVIKFRNSILNVISL